MEEEPYSAIDSAVRLYKGDYKICIRVSNYNGECIGITQYNPDVFLGPGRSNPGGYILYVYKPMETYLGTEEGDSQPPNVTGLSPDNGEIVLTSNPTLTWSYLDPEGVPQSHYQVYISSTSDFSSIEDESGLVASDSNTYTTSSLSEGIWYWKVRVRDGIRWSQWYEGHFIADILPPIGTINIENTTGYTQSTSVSLNLSASDICDVVEMRFSNDGIAWSPWVPYATSYTWDLVDPSYGGIDKDGIKYVYVEYKSLTGRVSTSYSDSIILDRGAPPSPSKPVGVKGLSSRTEIPFKITFTWPSVTDELSTTVQYLVDIIDDTGVVIDSDQTQETEYVFYPRVINTTYYARVRALDIAGNIGGYSPLSDGVDIVLQKSIIREYDANGNMIGVKEDVGGQVETLSVLTYDASDKLKTYTEDSQLLLWFMMVMVDV